MDVDTRLLRYFATVAQEGNLTRAAERLFVSQPALTKQIRQLESQLGVQLFTRSHAGMTLTAAGEALARQMPAVLAGFDQALREAKGAASEAARVLRVGFLAGAANEATQQITAAFARRRPGWRLEMRAASWLDPTAGLASGDTDVALLRLPFPGQDSLRVEVLFTEPRWVALPATHPLARRDLISFRDLWDEPFVAAPAETGWWRDWWLAAGEREGHPVRIGAVTETGQPDDWLTAIANGNGVALAPESAARYYARPGITYRPVTGVSPSQVGVAWPPAADINPVIQDFVRCCLESKPSQRPDHTPAAAWDAEYDAGRYLDEPPVAFTRDIVAAARQAGVARGLYIGCGNGRNYLPLVAAGLDLTGLDISAVAIAQLAGRAPGRRDRLICGDLTALPPGAAWPLVIGIQVFQHGDRAAAHAHIRAAQQRAAAGGLFCLRVNATGTDIWPEHEVTEREADGGLTVRYLAGPKQGLLIHFFSATELDALFADRFTPVVPLRVQRTVRTPPRPGQWSQWEGIWRKSPHRRSAG